MVKRAYFTVFDKNNEKFLPGLVNSLRKFDPETELVVFKDEVVTNYLKRDPEFFYRACPILASNLFNQGYDEVCKLDVDQIITGDISYIWEGDCDIATVLNTNPREMKNLVVSVPGVDPMQYMNCGLVVMRSKPFVAQWLALCHNPQFQRFQYREQDIMNLMIHYGNWKVVQLDGDKGFYGLSSKGYWPETKLVDDKIILPANEEWNKQDAEIKVIHFAGGNDPQKGNYNLYFPEEVVERIKWLTAA